ncbi:fatty acid--CoA ligase family protein [Oceanobacillus bengalensis]|uniref:Fatty acid--CoA ligase family protein n=1 Tax=Oceanobacillus bengalensis TaxID=1435466 RepID=A0A494Z8A0_9BACI|nr:fatty acid--CoA ligase family protein [Oceanobacillus bengalensis]RKQ18824.1 fatty acid--CoA ligase family protein [Oceanobacillus bengalensis]
MNLSEQLSITAIENPSKTAYIFENKETSYQELEGAVRKFASQLEEMGIKKGDHIALILGNSPYYVISLYGALRVGAVVIPINPLYTTSEITYILNNGDVKAVITMDVLMPKFASTTNQLANVDSFIVCASNPDLTFEDHPFESKIVQFTQLMQGGRLDYNGPILDEEDVAVILYTSGTTGNPKGALLTHRNLYSNAKDVADYLTISNQDRVIAALPMFHVFCLTVALNAPLMNGGTVLILPKFSPKEVFRMAQENQATIFAGVPTMYNFLLQTVKHDNTLTATFAGIRLCISGGAAMPVALLKAFEETFDVMLSEGYGLSEASPVTCFNPLDRPRKPGSIGRSIINVENKIVNEMGEDVQVGEVGELVVRGPNVMKGYYKNPEETAATLKDGWLYTGDMARMDDEGYFYIVDRKKDMIIVGGYNVYPREVEEILYSHPSVSEVAVIGTPHIERGEEVIAFVVTSDQNITEGYLKEFCKEHLAEYKVPSKIDFLDELPKNTTGKILRKSLRELIQH